METGILILTMGLVVLIMYWLVKNDGASTIADQKGLFRIAPPDDDVSRTAAEQRRQAATVKRRPS